MNKRIVKFALALATSGLLAGVATAQLGVKVGGATGATGQVGNTVGGTLSGTANGGANVGTGAVDKTTDAARNTTKHHGLPSSVS